MTKRLPIWAVVLTVGCAAGVARAAGAGNGESQMLHRMMMLVIQLGIILFAARIGNILFEKIKLPGALGELVAGMVIGPFALGQFGFYGFAQGLFPHDAGQFAVSAELYGIASVAAVVLLFTIGLETDLKLLLRYAVVGGLVGLGGMLASFFGGAAVVMLFSRLVFGEPLGLFAPPCLLLGTITTATSVGITARILSEKRKLDSPEGVTILSAAVIDDVMGIILLAVVMSVVTAQQATGAWGVGLIGIKAVGVWLAATVIGLVAARKISVLLKWAGERTSIAILALGLALILAGLFEEAGLAMIIGAYVMGLSLSKADIRHVIREKLAPIYALLVPVFFCVTGMQINLAHLGHTPVLIFGLVYAVVALASKLAGCGLPALLANFNLRGAARIGFGMAPRCEVALIIAGIGLGTGILPQELFAAVIVMVVVNTVIAPPALVFLFGAGAPRGTRRPVPRDKAGTSVTFDFPAVEMTEFFARKLANVFESEGFFVHPIGPGQHIYELRKDIKVISFTREGTALTFECSEPDVPLVNAAVYEALAAFEKAAQAMREPLDRQDIGARIQQAAPGQRDTLDLRQYLTPRLVKPRLTGRTKAEIIDELLALLKREGKLANVDAARQAVWQREKSMSTGLQYGVAIPHGKTDTVDGLVCAVGIQPEGVDFESMDGSPSRIFILTLSPASKPAPHVQFMSTVSQVLNETGRQRILECTSAGGIYRAFTAPAPSAAPAVSSPPPAPSTHRGQFNISDYLQPELVTPRLSGATGEAIIRELVDLLAGQGLVRDADAAARAVLDREATMSTGMESGVAVPHGRTDAVDRLVCAVGVRREGVDFGAADGKPSRIFVLVITPEAGADPYLQFVAALMGVLDEDGRQAVLAATTREQLYTALTHRAP